MVNIKIGLATDSMSFTPTETYQSNNGYAYTFSNGQPFTDVIEQGTPSISTGYTYGSSARTNTFKCKACASMIQIRELEQYNNIVVYKDGALVFCGYNPTFSKNIKKGVGADGRKESWVEASISFDDYSAKLKDRKFSSSEDFDLYYTSADNVYVCNVDNTAKSLVHILLGYLFPSGDFTVHIGSMPSVLKTTKVTYFSVNYDDKVLSVIKDVFEQAGLAYYIVNRHFYVIDVLETMSGTAVNIPNIEEDAVKKGRSFVELKIPEIKMATARIAEDVRVYDSGDMQIEGKDWAWEPDTYYPADDMYAEGSYTCEKKDDDHPNGKADDEKEKRYFNIREREWEGEISWFTGNGAFLDYFSHDKKSVKYRIRNSGVLRRSWRLAQKADVLLFRYATGFKPAEWDGEDKECDYVFSTEMAQRYANALMYQKKTEALYYEFYADVLPSYPNGFPINTVVSLQGTDETNPLLIITSKTDKFDEFGGYVYKAVPYDRAGVSLSPSYVESKETMPASDQRFTLSLSRDVIECYSNRTPRDTTAVRATVNVRNKLVTPELKVAGTVVQMERERVQVTVEGGTDWAETDNWIYDIDPNLNGYDTCQIEVSVNGVTVERTISKLVPNDGLNPDIIVPEGWVLVRQYCYGDENAPDPRFVEDADDTLEDADDLVSDIWWTDEVSGHCPLRPRNGYYIWMRQGIYDPETQTEPSTWAISLYDTPYLRFDFDVTPNTFVRNQRLKGQNDKTTISLTPNIVGYDTSLVVPYSSYGSFSFDQTLQQYILDIPYDNTEDLIRVGLVIGDIPNGNILVEKYVMLTVDDQTERNQYFGVYPVTEGGSTYNTPSDNPSNVCIVGDTFLKNDGTPMTLVSISSGTYSWTTASSKEAWATMLDDALSNPAVTLGNDNPYVTWIANLAVKDAFIRSLLTQKLQLQNGGYIWGGDVQLDANGAPEKINGRYVIGTSGGFVIDSSGYMQARESVFESVTVKSSVVDGDSTINGTIINTVPNDNDPTVIETVFRTNKEVQAPVSIKALKVDGTDTPSAYNKQEWLNYLNNWLVGLNLTQDTTYPCTSSDIFGHTITGLRNSSAKQSGTVVSGENCHDKNTHNYSWKNEYGKTIRLSAEINGHYTSGMFGIDHYNSRIDVSIYASDGTTLYRQVIHREPVSAGKQSTLSASFGVPNGYYVKAKIDGGGGQTFDVEYGHYLLIYKESDNWSSGLNFILTDGTSGTISFFASEASGFMASATSFTVNSSTKSLVLSASANWPVNKYYSFSFLSGYAPSNTELITTSLLQNKKYEYPDGSAKTIAYIQYKNDQISIFLTDGTSQTFRTASGNYYRSHDIDISTITSILGAFSQNIMPVYDENGVRVGTGYVGSQQRPWYQGFAEAGWQQGSLRARKENIERYLGKALELFNSVTVCSFRYKCDHDNPDGYTHYGFIADDTDERLSSPSHNIMEIGNCIGLLIKAVQELSQEIDNLKEK